MRSCDTRLVLSQCSVATEYRLRYDKGQESLRLSIKSEGCLAPTRGESASGNVQKCIFPRHPANLTSCQLDLEPRAACLKQPGFDTAVERRVKSARIKRVV